jgi:hypothetical protein
LTSTKYLTQNSTGLMFFADLLSLIFIGLYFAVLFLFNREETSVDKLYTKEFHNSYFHQNIIKAKESRWMRLTG